MVDIIMGNWITIWGIVKVYHQTEDHVWITHGVNGITRKYKVPKPIFVLGTQVEIYPIPKQFEEVF
jgi:hypothetical protein